MDALKGSLTLPKSDIEYNVDVAYNLQLCMRVSF